MGQRFQGRGTRLSRAAVVLAVTQLIPGCSWFLLETAPPPDKRNTLFFCNRSMGIPGLDAALSVLAFGNAVYALSKDSSDYQGEFHSQGSDIAVNAGFATFFAIAAGTGYAAVEECRAVSPSIPITAAVPAVLVPPGARSDPGPAESAPLAPPVGPRRPSFDPDRPAPPPAEPPPPQPPPGQ